MAVKASFGNNSNNRNDNSNSSSNHDTNITTNNEDINMHKEDSSPCWSSYWKFLQPQDEMWIVNDNARSHETRRLWNRLGSTSLETHWDPTKDSVVGFCNAKTNRWGVSPSLASLGESSHTATSSSTSTATPTHQNRNSSTRLRNCSTDPVTRLSLESSHSLEDTESVRQDSVLMQPSRRESLVLLDPIDLGLIRPERRVSDDSVLTFRTSIGSSTMGTFESILEDVCACSDLEDDHDGVDDDDDADDDDDDTYQDNITIITRSTNTDDSDNHTSDDGLVAPSFNRFPQESCGTNNSHYSTYTKAQHPDLQWPPMRLVSDMASETSNQQDGARRFAPTIRGTSPPNLDASSRNKGPSVPVRRSSGCSMTPAEIRSYFHQVHGSSSGTTTHRRSSFEAILEYEPMEDLPSGGDQTLLSRQSTTDNDDDTMDKRWIDAGSGTNGNEKALTSVPTRPTTDQDNATNKELSSDDDDDALQEEPSSSLLATNIERLCVDEYDRCHSRASYGQRRASRTSIISVASSSDQSSVAMPTRFLTKTDSVELGHVRLHNQHHLGSKRHGTLTKESSLSHCNDDDDGNNLLHPPPLIDMDVSSYALLRNEGAASMIGDDEKEEQDAMLGSDIAAESKPKMTHPPSKTPNNHET